MKISYMNNEAQQVTGNRKREYIMYVTGLVLPIALYGLYEYIVTIPKTNIFN